MAKAVKSYCIITLSCFAYALAFCAFYANAPLSCGGLTGVAQVLHALLPAVPIGAAVFVMNVPLFLLGFRQFGFAFLARSLYAVALSSALIDVLSPSLTFPAWDPMLSCLYGGLSLGAMLGILLRQDATTGGTELGARLLKRCVPHLSIGRVCLALDLAVIALYALVLRQPISALYGGIALYISSLTMDRVVYGGQEAKLAYIISERQEAIVQTLLAQGIGLTKLSAAGAYTGEARQVLFCAIRRREIVQVRRTVHTIDPQAFLIVCDAREVLGNGFSRYRRDEL